MKIHLDTLTIEMFIAIADTKSFSIASQIIGRTQPALSLQINKLEEQFECKFFKRNGNNIILTHYGEVFFHMQRKSSNINLNCICFQNWNA